MTGHGPVAKRATPPLSECKDVVSWLLVTHFFNKKAYYGHVSVSINPVASSQLHAHLDSVLEDYSSMNSFAKITMKLVCFREGPLFVGVLLGTRSKTVTFVQIFGTVAF